mmetsp:Transcript_21417/g.44494  ORF Transcript_21417/g.44494 Transcript_21417/m.44494 type:complete len:146 (-) Transcript_21417:97-534(-)
MRGMPALTSCRAWLAPALRCRLGPTRPLTTGSEMGVHEAVRRWTCRALPAHPDRSVPNLRATSAGAAWNAHQRSVGGDLETTKNVLSGLAIIFPFVAIPLLEARRNEIGTLEAEVAERNQQILHLKRELQTAWTTNSAAESGVIF